MLNNLQLQSTVLDELRHASDDWAICIKVSAKAGVIWLSGEVGSFAERYAIESMVRQIPGVKGVIDDVEIRLTLDRNGRLALAARRALAQASAVNKPNESVGSAEHALTMHLDAGLLTVTGQLDWRHKPRAETGGRPASSGKAMTSNISDDILNMLPRCFLSTSRSTR